MTLRRLKVLVRNLPADAKTTKKIHARMRAMGQLRHTKIEDAPPDTLSQTEWLLIYLHDEVQRLNYHYLLAHRDTKKSPPPPPKPLPRPGAVPQKRKTINAWFGAVGLAPAGTT